MPVQHRLVKYTETVKFAPMGVIVRVGMRMSVIMCFRMRMIMRVGMGMVVIVRIVAHRG